MSWLNFMGSADNLFKRMSDYEIPEWYREMKMREGMQLAQANQESILNSLYPYKTNTVTRTEPDTKSHWQKWHSRRKPKYSPSGSPV